MRTFYAFLSCSFLACFGLTTAPSAQAQEVIYDSVVLGEGNANMSFYSLANGELAQVPLADWHPCQKIPGHSDLDPSCFNSPFFIITASAINTVMIRAIAPASREPLA